MSMTQSPRIPGSPDASRRQFPRLKDKRRALRDFYGLQNQQESGPVKFDVQLDHAEFDVTRCLEEMARGKDFKTLLTLENSLIRDIRVLDGERKALIYDNYGKMIAATETLIKVCHPSV